MFDRLEKTTSELLWPLSDDVTYPRGAELLLIMNDVADVLRIIDDEDDEKKDVMFKCRLSSNDAFVIMMSWSEDNL